MTITKSKSSKTISIVASIAAITALTGCGGSDRDGTYVREEGQRLMTMTIAGDKVTHEVASCDEEVAEEPSVGEITEDGTDIVWVTSAGNFKTSRGTFDQSNMIEVTDSAIVMPYTHAAGGGSDKTWALSVTYVREGTTQADAVHAEHAEECG
ncbi:hypothetical protein ACQP1U_06290 [Actinomycetota bacterium]